MIRIDGYYLVQAGARIHPVADFRAQANSLGPATTVEEARYPIYIAEAALDELLHRSVFSLRTSRQSGENLLTVIRNLKAFIDESTDTSAILGWYHVFAITSAMTTFEAVLGAELSLWPIYIALPKAGYDTSVLIERGEACFPADIKTKVPNAVADLNSGTKCLAYELFTAAAFHLHRANESVLSVYWDIVSGGAPRPNTRNMGDYLREMNERGIGDERVKAALKDLKDLHRNPLIHPEMSINNVDDAVALMNSVHTVIVGMLKGIPSTGTTPPLVGTVPAPSLLDPPTTT